MPLQIGSPGTPPPPHYHCPPARLAPPLPPPHISPFLRTSSFASSSSSGRWCSPDQSRRSHYRSWKKDASLILDHSLKKAFLVGFKPYFLRGLLTQVAKQTWSWRMMRSHCLNHLPPLTWHSHPPGTIRKKMWWINSQSFILPCLPHQPALAHSSSRLDTISCHSNINSSINLRPKYMAQPTWHACLERNLPAPSKTYFDSFGLPLTVLCQTTGKLVLLAKFWVTAIWQREKRWWWKPISKPNTVVSMLRTTCHMPPGTKIVSPGCWMHSTGAYLKKFWVGIPTKWNLHYTMLIIKKF